MCNTVPPYSSAHLQFAVVGMGKIGLPLAVQYAQHGCRVIGCDINPHVVEMVNAGNRMSRRSQNLPRDCPM